MWPWISKAIGGAAVNHDRLQLRARQLRMVVSLMNYPIIWPNSGDGSRQRNLGTGNRKKLCFVISIQHLAQLTLEFILQQGEQSGYHWCQRPLNPTAAWKGEPLPSPAPLGRIHLSIDSYLAEDTFSRQFSELPQSFGLPVVDHHSAAFARTT